MSYLIAALALLCSVAVVSGGEMLAGGNTPQDPSDPEYMQHAWKAVQKINEDPAANSGPYVMIPIKVLKAESQVVSGVIHKLEVLYGESTAKKGVSNLLLLYAIHFFPQKIAFL
ncbi:hypothetical protein OESDEN_10600 [Oesophagostomum dentatum]|uniref:Cystatin domain-containing protein n=1 Tax=Oesophagostomum dentatum TaxID=61180 RepID=A0A0B1T1C7_OESDE|nr:hypothetical protein OESDEN_10600 [Oesophagostomum dentatum]